MIKHKKRTALFKSCLLVFGLQLSGVGLADDTEIYFSDSLTNADPNVMFVLDVSGSMDEEVESSGSTRFEAMKSALQTVVSSASSSVNIGLMNYGELPYRTEAHGIKFPITNIDSLARPIVVDSLPEHDDGNPAWVYSNLHEPSETITVRNYLSEMTDWYWKNSWYEVEKEGDALEEESHSGGTPIVGALFEAAMYFRGETVTFGERNVEGLDGNTENVDTYAHHNNTWAAHPSTYHGTPMGTKCGTTTTSRLNRTTTSIPDWYKCAAKSGDQDSPGYYENCEINEQCEIQTTTVTQTVTETTTVCEKQWSLVRSCSNSGRRNGCGGYYWSYDDVCSDQEVEVEIEEEIEQNFCDYEVCNEDQGSVVEADYKTPITEVCQNNYIVLLSDGQPTSYESNISSRGGISLSLVEGPVYTGLKAGTIAPLLDKSGGDETFSYEDCESNPTPSGFKSGICGPELTRFLADTDNSNLIGSQPINTYAIGFGLGDNPDATDYLKSLVTADDPDTSEVEGFFSVEDEVALSGAFAEILANITASTSSYASPGYSIDMKNGIQNEDFIYIPVFDKHLAPRWNGNLKKFKLSKSTVDGKSVTSITDLYGNVAVNELGVFEDSAVDFWSTATESVPDGKDVEKGGISELINPVSRTVLTDVACGASECDLSVEANEINETNALDGGSLTSTLLGLETGATEDERKKLVNFARGRILDVETQEYESVPHIGDMLHTEPVIVTYHEDHATTGVEGQQVIYAATNEGYLHAFDTTSGKELFAFMPESLLKNLKTQYDNSDLGNHAYGIDGIITTWVHDADGGGISAASGSEDQVILYFGMRRGGREYYALDVTSPHDPKLLWKIDGATTSGFSTLGQSWSTPYLAKIRVDASSAPREVAIFTGGYDTNQDNEVTTVARSADTVGMDIFIVDAKTGELLWSAQNGGSLGSALSNKTLLTHSIPGGARLLDMNEDGAVDRMYFADTGGQIFRLELPIGPTYGFADARLVKFADLGGSDINPRMFFNEPDVAMFTHLGKRYLTVSIGSGYRAHPANSDIEDRFYVLIDGAVNIPLETKLNSTESFVALTESANLVEITATGGNSISSIDEGTLEDKTIMDVDGKSGWYFVLPEDSEKVLATSVTSQGNVMFTTLVPDANAEVAVEDLCESPQTQGRYYSMNVLTGNAGSDLNGDGTITDSDLMLIISENEIPGSPQQVFNEPVCTSDACSQFVDIRVGKKNSALEEHDVSKLESVFWTDPTK
ncbi:PilC/PilY family type IV pilus protein [Leucothrix arctica]|nr:PilC/PilY family type IV pilus protein [Leucothrix arctica]